MRVAFDMAAFCWRALLAGVDEEHGRKVPHEGKEVQVNSAIYGYDLVVGMMVEAMKTAQATPHRCILVFEGMHSKRRRQAIEASYKGNRESRPPEAYAEYQTLQGMLKSLWKSVGAICMSQDYVEGDDVLAYLAVNSEEDLMIATYDNDLSAVNGTNAYGAEVTVWVNGKLGFNKYGDFDYSLITLWKALIGDTNDNIKGCPGFGEKSWDKLRASYGDDGLQELMALLEAGNLGDLHLQREEDAGIRKICDNEAQTIRSYKLAKLHPEWVDTAQHALKIEPGMCAGPVDDERLQPWAAQKWLVTRENFAERAAFCRAQFKRSPFIALDIETSTPPESDEWLANQTPPNPDGVDVLGSRLTGLSLTFGDNLQYTVYISVDHARTDNVSSEEVRQLVADAGPGLVIQNLSFELTVLYQEWAEQQLDNGWEGFLPGCLDTKMEASYVNENIKNGLKLRSKTHLGYDQVTYDETVTREGKVGTLLPGGRRKGEVHEKVLVPARYWHEGAEVSEAEALKLDEAGLTVEVDDAVIEPEWEIRKYKMNELSGADVFDYGADDTITTAALHNFYQLVMGLEHTWAAYIETELDAAYMSAVGFIQGTDFSPAKMRELAELDDKTYDAAWATVRDYLISKGWDGSVCPTFTNTSKAADFKLAYQIVSGKVLDSQARLPEKLAKLMAAEGQEVLGELLLRCYKLPTYRDDGEMTTAWQAFNDYVKKHFKGEPDFNIGSPKQKQKLLYELIGLPIVMRNKPTDQMRAAGIREGGAKTDALAIDWALKFNAKAEDRPVLEALKLMQMVETRRNLFYNKYNGLVHWKTGKLHSQTNQCEANTRRSSENGPNKTQLPKAAKLEGQPPRFREVIAPHHSEAVVVSLDESSQELRIITDYSKDPGMVACYVGDNKKDMHSMAGLGIAKWKYPAPEWSYEVFDAARHAKDDPLHAWAKECRVLGKKVVFTTEYGAAAAKVAETLLVTEEEAEAFIAAKEEAFPVAAAWKLSVVEEARNKGYVTTKLGARRHLRDAFNSSDSYESSKAERQAVNFKIQSSAAEQTKRAYGAAWRRRLAFKYDAVFIGPIHDEVVWSVAICDLVGFIREMHECMTQPYGDMTIPIESSISIGPNFGEQVEIGDQPSEEAIEAGLKEVRKLLAKKLEAVA